MSRVPVYILAGGKSRRFGTDKARASLRDRPLMLHIIDRLRDVADAVTAVADAEDKYADLGVRTVADTTPGLGPIGGLATALTRERSRVGSDGWLLLCGCDIVEPQSDWVRRLLDSREAGAAAVAYRHDWWEPLLGLYHVSIAGLVDEQIERNDLKMQHLLDIANTLALPRPDAWTSLPQVNTRQDLESYDA